MTWTFYEYFVFETVTKITELKGMGSARDGGWRHMRMWVGGPLQGMVVTAVWWLIQRGQVCLSISISEGWLRSKPSSEVGVQLAGLLCSPVSGS